MDVMTGLRDLVQNRRNAVYDSLYAKALAEIPWADWHREPRPFFCRLEYLKKFDAWIHASRLNRIEGLAAFEIHHLINGTTQSFDEAYFKHRDRRLRVFRGEYAYHRRICGETPYLDDEPLEAGDYVIVSAPFCSTGVVHPRFDEILDEAGRLNIPVIVDCAYFGTCMDISLRLDHPAIESVSFSLTKGLGLGDARSGIRYSRIDDHLPISQQNKYDHSVLATAKMGLHMMNLFSADHIPTRFRETQLEVCRELGIRASSCMHIAIGGAEWDHYKVDGLYNTLGIREVIRARFKKRL